MFFAVAAFQSKCRSLLSFKTCHCDTSFLSASSVYHTHQLSINPVEPHGQARRTCQRARGAES
jgi:hypothetical protein